MIRDVRIVALSINSHELTQLSLLFSDIVGSPYFQMVSFFQDYSGEPFLHTQSIDVVRPKFRPLALLDTSAWTYELRNEISNNVVLVTSKV